MEHAFVDSGVRRTSSVGSPFRCSKAESGVAMDAVHGPCVAPSDGIGRRGPFLQPHSTKGGLFDEARNSASLRLRDRPRAEIRAQRVRGERRADPQVAHSSRAFKASRIMGHGGLTGARAGFTVEWIRKAEFAASGLRPRPGDSGFIAATSRPRRVGNQGTPADTRSRWRRCLAGTRTARRFDAYGVIRDFDGGKTRA